MPNSAFVLLWAVEWMFAISFIVLVFLFCIHHVCTFWAACFKGRQEDSTAQDKRDARRRT